MREIFCCDVVVRCGYWRNGGVPLGDIPSFLQYRAALIYATHSYRNYFISRFVNVLFGAVQFKQ